MPDQEIVIRPVRSDDAEAIWTMSLQPGVFETTLTLPSDRLEHRMAILGQLTANDHYFVAEVAGRIVGLAGLSVGQGRLRHSGHIFVFVDRSSQGQGVGTQLLHTLLELADNWLLLRRVELTVLAENEGAKRLYERAGFVVEGLRKFSIIGQGELKDEWAMARYRL